MRQVVGRLRCVECGETSADGRGWRAYRGIEDEEGDPEIVVLVFCAACAAREFDTD